MLVIYELIDLLPESFKPVFSPRLNELFYLLKKEKLSEKEAANRFVENKTDGKYFNKLKNKLKRVLINHCIIQPSSWANTKHKILCDTCHKDFSTYKILLASGRRNTAIELASKLLPKAKALELHLLVYSIALDLEYHNSAVIGSTSQTKKFTVLANEQLEIIKAERIIRRHYSKTNLIYNTRNSFPPSIIEEFEKAAAQVQGFLALNSDKLNRLIYNITIMSHYVSYDYPKVIFYCNKALKTLQSDHPNFKSFQFAFLQKQVTAMIALSNFTEAKIIAQKASALVEPGKFNWHIILLQRIMVCFHANNYQEAYDLYKAHQKYNCNYNLLTEYWNIIKGYMFFLIKIGRIKPYTEERFNLGKFLNELPIYSQDKSGTNINILIIQILIEMQRGQFGRIIDRIDALQTYTRKHTRKVETLRAYIFINMIVVMGKASFHRAATERKTQKLFEKLKNTPLRMGQNIEVEILPFEKLWNNILELLVNKFRAQKLNKNNAGKIGYIDK